MIHLDTNYLIGLTKPTTPAGRQVAAWLIAGERLGCSAMAWAEYLCGPVTAADQADVAAVVGTPEPVTGADAAQAAALSNAAARRRGSLSATASSLPSPCDPEPLSPRRTGPTSPRSPRTECGSCGRPSPFRTDGRKV